MIRKLEKLTIRDTFKQWRDKINILTDNMASAMYADDNGVLTIGAESNTERFVVTVRSDFTGEVNFNDTNNTGSYISSTSTDTVPGVSSDHNASGLVLTGESENGEYIPWISGKTASGSITQYTTKEDNNLYFAYVDDTTGESTELFHWDDNAGRIDGTITHSITSDNADKIKTTDASSTNKNYNVFFGETNNDGYSDIYGDGNDITYNPSTNTLTVGTVSGNLNGTASNATNAESANKLSQKRTITLSNHVSGSIQFDGSENVDISVTIPNTGVTQGTYGSNEFGTLSFGGTITIPTYSVNERGQITQSSNVSLTLPATPKDELVAQIHSATDADYPILSVTTANAQSSNDGGKTLFNKEIKINPRSGAIKATNANITETLTARTVTASVINASAINAPSISINNTSVANDDNVLHLTNPKKDANNNVIKETVVSEKIFKANTHWNNSSDAHDIGFTVNSNNNRGGIYDWTNAKWILFAEADGSVTRFVGSADKLTTARQLKVNLASTTNVTFDGSANQNNIPVSGILDVPNGGTGVTEVAAIKAGKDANGNVITSTYATKAQLTSLAPLASPAFTGTPTSTTVTNLNDSSTKIATTAFVSNYVDNRITQLSGTIEAMEYKGTIGTNATVPDVPDNHKKGWVYKVKTAGSYAGKNCEVGDMIICNTTRTTRENADWDVIQGNLDNTVTNASQTHSSGTVVIYNASTGNVIKDSGFTIGCSVPANAKFTDTTYAAATTNTLGLVKVPTANGLSVTNGSLGIGVASASAFGVIKAGTNISISSGTLSVATATTNVMGVLKVPTANGLSVTNGSLGIGVASASAFGVVKVGSNISVTSGTISLTKANITSALGYTPPTSDTNTTYTAFKASGSTAAAGLVPKPSTTAGTTKYLCENGTWSVPPDTNTTYAVFKASGTTAAAGLVPKPSTTAGTTKYLCENGTWKVPPDTNTTYAVFKASGSTAAAGLVPKPATTAGSTKYLCENGTWKVPPDTNTTYAVATTSANGLMSAADKKKLNSLSATGVSTGVSGITVYNNKALTVSGGYNILKAPSDGKYFFYGTYTVTSSGGETTSSRVYSVNKIVSASGDVIKVSASSGTCKFTGFSIKTT